MTMKSIISFSAAWLAALPLLSQAMGPEAVPPAAMPFHVGQIAVTSLSDTQYVLPNDGKIFGAGANDPFAECATKIEYIGEIPA
jgi:hypothetical protein